MQFKDFSDALSQIEATTLRNTMMELLAALMKQVDASEVSQMVYLALGYLRPKFDRLEFNLAEKMIMRAIARAYNTDVEEVGVLYKNLGDLGAVVFQIAQMVRFENGELSISEVYEALEKIAQDEGQGSQERKVDGLSKLLLKLDAKSAYFVVRMVVGKLRLGFSDKTILDALSYMERGTKDGRKDLDYAYQVSPDIGKIARLVKDVGIEKAASKVKVEYGIPVVPALAQRLKTANEMIDKMGMVALEAKYDGTRVQIHFSRLKQQEISRQDGLFAPEVKRYEVRTFTRNLDENSFMFPELDSIADQIRANEVILDSEAVGYDPTTHKLLPFQMTITRKRKHGIGEMVASVPLKFFVFDILYLDGKSLIDMPLSERRKFLVKVVKSGKVLEVDEMITTDDPAVVRKFHSEQLANGLEGAMVKQLEGVYSPGRTGFNWVKFKEAEESEGKLSDTIDAVVMGYYKGKGKRVGFGVGAFLVGVLSSDQTILTLAKIGTGLSDEQWKELFGRMKACESVDKPKEYGLVHSMLLPDVWVDPKVVVEVAADEITQSPTHSAGVALRFPRLVKFRDDKSWAEITTVEELAAIHT